jgi:hypothetical protein
MPSDAKMEEARANLQRRKSAQERGMEGPNVEHLPGSNQ